MSTEAAVIICALILGALALKWYADRKQREATSEFFRKHLDREIDERQKAIDDQAKKAKESADEYFKKMAKYRDDHKRGVNNPGKGSD